MRPCVLSIAGFDPSAGAGVLADVKTFEVHKTYGLGVVSALTWQNESEFERTEWLPAEKIITQTEILLRKSKVEFAKIGLIENAEVLSQVADYLNSNRIKIIWDPVLKASAGFDFHSGSAKGAWTSLLDRLFLITPNWTEASWLAGEGNLLDEISKMAANCHIYLKGGHNPEKTGYDYLFIKNEQMEGKQFTFRPKVRAAEDKHGSGCVLSASLTALLAKGYGLHKAGLKAKGYTARFLESSKGLLGYHKF